MYSDDCVYFSGSSRLPGSIPSGGIHRLINVGMMIDTKTGEIVDVSTTLLSKGATRFLSYLIIGHNVHEDGIDSLVEKIQTRYFGDSQKSICVAIKSVYRDYIKYMEDEKKIKIE